MTNEFRGIRDDDESHTHSLTTQTYRFASTSTSSSSSRSFNARVARPVRSRPRPRSRVLRLDAKRSSLGVDRSPIAIRRDRIRRRDERGIDRTERGIDRTEPNRTRRTLGGGVSRSRARRTRHSSASFAHFRILSRVDANGRARDDANAPIRISWACRGLNTIDDTSSRDR